MACEKLEHLHLSFSLPRVVDRFHMQGDVFRADACTGASVLAGHGLDNRGHGSTTPPTRAAPCGVACHQHPPTSPAMPHPDAIPHQQAHPLRLVGLLLGGSVTPFTPVPGAAEANGRKQPARVAVVAEGIRAACTQEHMDACNGLNARRTGLPRCDATSRSVDASCGAWRRGEAWLGF